MRTPLLPLVVLFSASLLAAFGADKPLRVALYDDAGSAGLGVPKVKEQLGSTEGMELTVVKSETIKAGALDGYSAIIFTGGSGKRQADAIGTGGVQAVRKFVENGGGYVGICAGDYLACEGFSWGTGLLNAKTVSSKWRRGSGTVKIELTPAGKKILGWADGLLDVHYGNGPIIKRSANAALPKFEPLALYRTELAENGTPAGVMVDSPAIVMAQFGKGRVLCSSPHPEQTPGLESFIASAVRWVCSQ